MSQPNSDQESFWRDQAGRIWVDQRQAMDATLQPVLDHVLRAANLQAGDVVHDIGCGAGTSTIAAGHAVGHGGSVCGLDISGTLLAGAKTRGHADHVCFVLGDAQTYAFQKERADCVISRFGVMFFSDPVAAFANIRTALRSGGTIAMAAWGSIGENPYFMMPAAIAKVLLGPTPKSDPDAPGPFAFRDEGRVEEILSGAGFDGISIEKRDIALTPDGDAHAVASLLCQIGPAHSALNYFDANAATRAALHAALEEGLQAYDTPDGIRIPAQINLITARKPA